MSRREILATGARCAGIKTLTRQTDERRLLFNVTVRCVRNVTKRQQPLLNFMFPQIGSNASADGNPCFKICSYVLQQQKEQKQIAVAVEPDITYYIIRAVAT